MHATPTANPLRRVGFQNAMLTAIAVLLALGLIDRAAPSAIGPQQATAQPSSDGGMTNALEQRKQMIGELRVMNSRLERIEAKLGSGISVKVVDMPPLKMPPEQRTRSEKDDGKQTIEVKPAEPKGK